LKLYERRLVFEKEHTVPGVRNHIVILPIVECVAPIAYSFTMRALSEAGGKISFSGEPGIDTRIKFLSHGYGCTHIGPEKILVEESMLLLLLNPSIGGIVVFELGCGSFGFRMNSEFIARVRPDTPVIYVRVQPRSYPSTKSIIATCNIDGEGCSEEAVEYSELYDHYAAAFKSLLQKVLGGKRRQWDQGEAIPKIRLGVINGASNPSSIISNMIIGRLMEKYIMEENSVVVEGQFSELVPEKIMRMTGGDPILQDKLMRIFRRSLTFKQAPEQPEPTPGNIKGGIATLEVKQVMTTLRVPFHDGIVDPTVRLNVIGLEDMISTGRLLFKNINSGKYGEAARIVNRILGYGRYRRGILLVESAGYDPMTGNILAMLGVQAIFFTTGLGTPWGALIPTIKVTADMHAWRRFGGPRGFIDYYIDLSEPIEKILSSLQGLLARIISGEPARHEHYQPLISVGFGDKSIPVETYNLTLQQIYMRA
jgi:altronate hydrolase